MDDAPKNTGMDEIKVDLINQRNSPRQQKGK